jgi:hypothetical protein
MGLLDFIDVALPKTLDAKDEVKNNIKLSNLAYIAWIARYPHVMGGLSTPCRRISLLMSLSMSPPLKFGLR